MHGHLPPLARVVLVAKALVRKILEGVPPPHKDASLSVLGLNHVVGLKACGRSNLHAFLSCVLHVERDAALPLRIVEHLVHGADPEHVLVHAQDTIPIDSKQLLWLSNAFAHASVFLHEPVDRDAIKLIRVNGVKRRTDWKHHASSKFSCVPQYRDATAQHTLLQRCCCSS